MQKIECSNLSASYGKKLVLQNVSLSIEQGEFACLCGPNGSGKSTLLSLLAGLPSPSLHQTDGSISPDARKLSRRDAAHLIAYLQQNETCAWDFPLLDYVVQGRFSYTGRTGAYSPEDYQIARDSLAQLNLEALEKRTVHSLSGGEFQKVRIARALTQQPAFLLLDEPAANLDFVYEPRLMALLASLAHERKIGILASVHDVNLAARYADKMHMLCPAGTSGILSGTPEQIMNTQTLEKIYGVPFVCNEKSFFQSSL